MAIKKSGKAAAEEKITVNPDNIKVDRAKEFEKSISFDCTLFGCVKIYGCTYRTYTDKNDNEEKGIISYLRPEGKAQITAEYNEDDTLKRIDTIVVSTQHDKDITI